MNKKRDPDAVIASLENNAVSSVLEKEERVYLGVHYPTEYFTPREMDCARELLQEKTIKEMAHSMGISPRSVEFYLRNMRFKLGVDSKKELFITIRDKIKVEI